MAKNLLVINVDIRETRVALIENGIIAELHIERETSKGTLGNIYLGKVSRVLPGMQAAFIDVGLERAAFLHVEDLIRPDDFEAYLAGARRGTDDDRSSASGGSPGGRGEAPVEEGFPPVSPPPDEPSIDVELQAGEADEEAEHDVDIELPTALEVSDTGDAADREEARGEAEVEADERVESEVESDERVESDVESDVEAEVDEAEEVAAEADGPAAEVDEPDDEPRAEATADESADLAHAEEGEHPATAAAPAEGAAAPAEMVVRVPEEDAPVPRTRGRRGRGRGEARVRRSGSTVDRQAANAAAATAEAPKAPARQIAAPAAGAGPRQPAAAAGGGRSRSGAARRDDRGGKPRSDERGAAKSRDDRGPGRRDGRSGGGREPKRGAHLEPPRISKSTPIREVVREGQEVLVQISKEPIGTKGARVTSHISLPGRYVVYLPTVDHIGISKRIGSDKERSRLRESIEAMKPPQGGLIVRTVAEGLTKKQLKADVGYLVRLWGEVVKKRETGVRAPVCHYTELDLVLKTARDLFTDDIEKIVIDSREEYERLRRFVEIFMPERVDAVELYQGEEPIFDAYGIEDEIQRAQSRKVPLPSGGHLIIDQAEALTAIDVNTGRFVGKGSKDLEETILATNLEAVEEIAYQLRFRNIGGLIILDLIDMERPSNREKVRKRLEELLSKDKAKTTLNRISDLGLIEMTRKRTRESLGRTVLEPCFYCDGTGQLQSKQTIAYEILRQIRRERMNLPGYIIVVSAHPAVIDLLKSDERVAVTEAERLFQRRLELVPRKEYHLEQFDLQGR
jgi:ribonuclease G